MNASANYKIKLETQSIQNTKYTTENVLLTNLFIYRNITIAGEGRLEVGDSLQGQIHVKIDHGPHVHTEYKQHFQITNKPICRK